MTRRALLILIGVFLSVLLPAQTSKNDSLLAIWRDTLKPDTIRIKALHKVAWSTIQINADSALAMAKTEYDFAVKTKNRKYQGAALGTMGVCYEKKGDYPTSLEKHFLALEIREELGDKYGLISSYTNIGIVMRLQSEYAEALRYYNMTLDLCLELNDTTRESIAYLNMGSVYNSMDSTDQALVYLRKALVLKQLMGDQFGMALTHENIGSTLLLQKKISEALLHLDTALRISIELDNKLGMASVYSNIGLGQFDLGQYDSAVYYCTKGYGYAIEVSSLDDIQHNCRCLYMGYNKLGQYEKALKYYVEFIDARDTLNNEARTREINRQMLQFDYDKRVAADSIQAVEDKRVVDIKFKGEQNLRYALYGGLALVLIFTAFLFNRFRVTRQQKAIIENQKIIVEEKQKEVIDSITYAKRLQDAILPSDKLWNEHLPDSFIFYKPKDIVAGDFYFLERKADLLIFAAADCTGHGVPGAMMSMVCSNALSRALKEFNLTDPGKILDKVRELVVDTYAKSESEVLDGMDIALCCYNPVTHQLSWAGANNALWYCESNATEMKIIRADKQPIGKSDNQQPFTTHHVQLQKGDCLYVFTDGYADQFGGDSGSGGNGKKFTQRKFRDLLVSIASESTAAQKNILSQRLTAWQGNLEQVDDICVIGVRV